jgi:hypothetical protein
MHSSDNILGSTSQPHHAGKDNTPLKSKPTAASDCSISFPLGEFFLNAVEQNRIFYASRESTNRYSSPLFHLVRCLKSHPTLKDCTAEDAFTRLNSEVGPDWAQLFPDVPLPSLEFMTAWGQAKLPVDVSLWETIEEHAKNWPVTLSSVPACEGY